MSSNTSAMVLQPKLSADMRDELEQMVIKDLLGPAGGPTEEVDEAVIQDRYLVGKLAPRNEPVPRDQSDEFAVADGEAPEDGTTEPILQGVLDFLSLSFSLGACRTS